MANAGNDIIAEFTREITKLNIALKQYLQLKLRQNNIDLTFEMFQVLHCLWTTDGINQQEIANITVKDKASMTYLIDNLVKRNLVYRLEDKNDRRNKLINLTGEGKAMQCTVQPWLAEIYTIAGMEIKQEVITKSIKEIVKMQDNLKVATG